MTYRAPLFLALTLFVTLFTTPALALWVQDCDARPNTHCFHGPAGGTMANGGAIYFDLSAGRILEGHPGTVNNTAYLLSEFTTGTIKFYCRLGTGPSTFRFSVGPAYSFVETTGPHGDLSKAQIIGSAVTVSHDHRDEPADVSHRVDVDVLFTCPSK